MHGAALDFRLVPARRTPHDFCPSCWGMKGLPVTMPTCGISSRNIPWPGNVDALLDEGLISQTGSLDRKQYVGAHDIDHVLGFLASWRRMRRRRSPMRVADFVANVSRSLESP